MVYNSFLNYSNESDSKIFQEFVLFIDDNNVDTKKITIQIINLMIKYTVDKEKVNKDVFINQQAKLLAELNDVGLLKYLEKNAQYQDSDFQKELALYQKLTDEVVKGSNYQVEIYKKKFKEMENHCIELEKKVESVFLNQNYYDEILEDFIYYKKLADICMDRGGLNDPSNIIIKEKQMLRMVGLKIKSIRMFLATK